MRWLTPQMPPEMFTADAAMGFRLTPLYRGAERTQTGAIPLSFNSLGLRDREYGARPAGGWRIYVLGDSFVFGQRVPAEETFAKVLERALQERLPGRQVDVINGGVPRFGTLQEVALFERTVAAVQPDVVVLGIFVGNDVLDNLAFAHTRARRGGESFTHSVADWVRMHSHLYIWLRRRQHAAVERQHSLQRHAMETHSVTLSPEMQQGLTLTEDAIARLATTARQHGARLALVLIPSAAQVYPPLWQQALAHDGLAAAEYDSSQPNTRLAAWAEAARIPLLDLQPAWQAHGNEPLYFTLHWNARGHAVAAEATAQFLDTAGLLARPDAVAASLQ